MRTAVVRKWLNGVPVMAIGIAAMIFAPARAQQDFPEFSTFELFPGAESVEPKPDVLQTLAEAIRKAQSPAPCALGRLKIRTPEGDPIFQASLAAAREAAVLQALNGLGVPVAGRLFVESTVFGGSGGHDTAYETPRDRKPPKLTTNSVPRKGSKVKAGDQIRVTMVARDDSAPWPSGLKTIQLVADSENGRFIASENYAPCAEPAERRVEATYTVPQNPPPLVRLTALADDHARHMAIEIGEFPTGEVWKGSIKLEHDGRNPNCSPIKSETEFTIAVAGDGTVTGSGTLDHSSYTCEGYTTPGTRGPVAMGGKKQAGAFTLYLSDWPKTAMLPRLPLAQWTVQVSQDSIGEATFTPTGVPDVIFRIKLKCQTCGQP